MAEKRKTILKIILIKFLIRNIIPNTNTSCDIELI